MTSCTSWWGRTPWPTCLTGAILPASPSRPGSPEGLAPLYRCRAAVSSGASRQGGDAAAGHQLYGAKGARRARPEPALPATVEEYIRDNRLCLLDPFPFTLEPNATDVSAQVGAAPEPASLVLLGTGLVGTFLARERAGAERTIRRLEGEALPGAGYTLVRMPTRTLRRSPDSAGRTADVRVCREPPATFLELVPGAEAEAA